MDAPADTLRFMIAGYAVIFVVLAIYLVSLVIRWRNLRQDEEILENLGDEKHVQVEEVVQRERPVRG